MRRLGPVVCIVLTILTGVPELQVLHAASSPAAASPTSRFPIVSRFELPRRYGYFIGDTIPLTLVLETTPEVVLDLVNLPRAGEKHGLFEIRAVTLSTSETETKRIYRAQYTLQYFGAAPIDAEFAPLEILYALPDDGALPGSLQYRRLLTQPVVITIARLGPYRPTRALDVKGPLPVHRWGWIWGGFACGILLLGTVVGAIGRQWYQRWQQQQKPCQEECSAVEQTLRILQHEVALLRPREGPSLPLRLGHLMREFLQAEYGVPAFAMTSQELANHLPDTPWRQELLALLRRCDCYKYQPPTASEAEEQELLWDTLLLFEKLQQGRAP